MQFMTIIKLLHMLVPECHPQGVCWNKGIQVKCANYHVEFVFRSTSRLPEDSTPVTKYAGV